MAMSGGDRSLSVCPESHFWPAAGSLASSGFQLNPGGRVGGPSGPSGPGGAVPLALGQLGGLLHPEKAVCARAMSLLLRRSRCAP